MLILSICAVLVLINAFVIMFYSRIRNRGTIALHRRRDNARRRPYQAVDVEEIITTGDILKMMNSRATKP